ncbi:MAG: 8-oxo-dGTP diphosphatase [Chlamydiales bacterium]|jgi:8-oxo-dGTP diphosphatase
MTSPAFVSAGSEIYLEAPEGFSFDLEVAAAHVEYQEQVLCLKRAFGKSEGNLWGMPAGKKESGETIGQTLLRELYEETGIVYPQEKMDKVGQLYIRKKDCDYTYHIYRVQVKEKPEVQISLSEHQDYRWVTYDELLTLPLMDAAREAFCYYHSQISHRERPITAIAVHLILREGGKVLLSLRKNTGWQDGNYGLISGHVEHDEGATQAMVREALEEGGIKIDPSDLKFVHVMHRRSDRIYSDFFYECRKWTGQVENREPDKCGGVTFFSETELPQNTIPYISQAIRHVSKGGYYSEMGW